MEAMDKECASQRHKFMIFIEQYNDHILDKLKTKRISLEQNKSL